MQTNTNCNALQGLYCTQAWMSKYTESHTGPGSTVWVQCLALTLGTTVARKINPITQEWDSHLKECLAETLDVKITAFRAHIFNITAIKHRLERFLCSLSGVIFKCFSYIILSSELVLATEDKGKVVQFITSILSI